MTEIAHLTKEAFAIRHVHFETLGTFEHELQEAGYSLRYVDVASGGLTDLDPLRPDLLVVLDGPIGVYDAEAYPFVERELAVIKTRLDAGLPMLEICLGAQLIAAALGAKVAPAGVKEIGFAPIELTEAGKQGLLRHLAGVPVLHWHSDAFDLPHGAELLATTEIVNQAFSRGVNVLGLQFHPEADTGHDFEASLIGHAAELAGSGIEPRRIRADARAYGPELRDAGRTVFAEWLSQLEDRIQPAA